MANTGGWADKLAGTYLDKRKRIKIESANSARDAVNKILMLIQK